jgi:hypothetical protein
MPTGVLFSQAFNWLLEGKRVQRPHWGGYLIVQVPDENSKMNQRYIYAVCKNGEIVPAVINQLDMFATDWMIAE